MSHMILQCCTTVARHLPTSIDTPYKQAIFQTRLDFQERTMDAAVPIPPHGMVHMLNIRLQLLPPSSRASTHTMAHIIGTFAVRRITLTNAPSSDHLTNRTILSLHRTTFAFAAQRTHQEVRHIARSITYHCTTLTYWRFRTCVLSYERLLCEHS